MSSIHTRSSPSPESEAFSVMAATWFLFLLAMSAFGQVIGTTNTLEHVSDYTRMWSLSDPFAFQTVSNLQSAVTWPQTNLVLLSNGASTNQALIRAKPDVLNFDTAYAGAGSLTNGQIAWDSANHTLSVGLENGVILQLGQELPIPVENRTGHTITNGMVVGFAGTVAASGRILVSPFMADNSIPSDYFLGMVTSDDGSGGIANMGTGYVTWFGKVRGRDTTGAFDGEYWPSNGVPLYVSTNRPGFLTINKPQAPDPVITVGSSAYRSVNQGTVNIRPRWHCSIRDLDDIDGTVPTASGQILVYDAARRVHDFTANINSYATTQSLFTVSNLVAALSAAGPLTNAAAFATAAQGSNADAAYVAVTGRLYGLTFSWVSNSLAALASSTSTAFNASNIAVSANAAATNAAAVAALAYAQALEASGSASAAYSLASTYYASVTGAVARSVLAYDASTNALAIAQAIRGQNEYPDTLWSELGGALPQVLPYHARFQIDGTSAFTGALYSVSWPTNVHWQVSRLRWLTNAYTSDTNNFAGAYANGLLQVPASAGIPYPLQPVTGASDSWLWDYVTAGVTNQIQLTAATSVSGGVDVYLALTNRYSGYLYGTNLATVAAYTSAASFVLSPLVDGLTSGCDIVYWREPAVTSRIAFADAAVVDANYAEFSYFYNDIWSARTVSINGQSGNIGASNLSFTVSSAAEATNTAVYVTGLATQNLASVASLYTLMATSRVERWYANTTNWVTWTGSNVVTAYYVTSVPAYTTVTFSADFEDTSTHGTLYPQELSFPFSTGGWAGYVGDYMGFTVNYVSSPGDATWMGGGLTLDSGTGYSYGTAYLSPHSASFTTNIVAYYLPTNVVTPETWSYDDQVDWMLDGHPGQIWASDIANSSANSAVNGHVGLGTAAHPLYALVTGGALTNTALAGTVTIGGVTRSSWPNGVTSLISVATLPVFVNPATGVYYTAVSTVSVLSNDVTALNLNGSSLAQWTWRVDCTTTQALYSTWATNIVWDCPPELTCTGLYVFAMSSVDGVTIQGRQLFPRPCEGHKVYLHGGYYATSPSVASPLGDLVVLETGQTFRNHMVGLPAHEVRPIVFSFVSRTPSQSAVTLTNTPEFAFGEATSTGASELLPQYAKSGWIPVAFWADPPNTYRTTKIYLTDTKMMWQTDGVSLFVRKTVPLENDVGPLTKLVIEKMTWRYANDLEIRAYGAGGFPAAFKQD